ncbi:MAG: nuclear transport factor 2 family protein [Solirubrobacterales bacterium]
MSEENVETLKRAIDGYNRRDVAAILADADPEAEWHFAILAGLGGEATVYRGQEDVREGLRDLFDTLSDLHVAYPEYRDLGDRIVGIGHIRARGAGSGAETESPHALVADFKDGKMILIRTYLDPAEALEAAGLSE